MTKAVRKTVQQVFAARRAVTRALSGVGVVFPNAPKTRDIVHAAIRAFDPDQPLLISKADQRNYLFNLAARVLAAPLPTAPKTIKKVEIDVPHLVEGVDVRTMAFLSTRAWRRARYQAIVIHGNRCQCCGAGVAEGRVINVDHIKPRKTNPELALTVENLQVLCDLCNAGKGNWDSSDWRESATAPRIDSAAVLDLATLRELRERGILEDAA